MEAPSACGDGTCAYDEIYVCQLDCDDNYLCGDGVCNEAEAYNGCTEDCALAESVADYDAPDFVLFMVSGHCFGVCPGRVNREYLFEQGTADEVAWVFEARGYEVFVLVYADSFYDYTDDGDSYLPLDGRDIVDGYGFLTLLREMAEVRDRWIVGNPSPPGLIMVAHSHGNVWASMAMHLLWDVPVDVWVSLDAESLGWEDDSSSLLLGDRWSDVILDYSSDYDVVWPWDIWNPADGFVVDGQVVDIEDLIPSSVQVNLEVAGSQLISPINDSEPNVRLDGSYDGLYSVQIDEPHERVDDPDSDALAWVTETLASLYGF